MRESPMKPPDDALLNRARLLQEADVSKLRLSMWSRLDSDRLRDGLRAYPGRSIWLPETSEYAFVQPWRYREEIANLVELSAVRHPDVLVDAAAAAAVEQGDALLLMVEIDESRRPSFYERIGFELLEEVVTYELGRLPASSHHPERLRFEIANIANPDDLEALMRIDEASFPWVWRNSVEEFREYSESPGVEIFLGRLDGRPVSLIGITSYLGWGHIDRVAVLPEFHGTGLGTESVLFAIRRMASGGVKKIGLSTQRKNVRSQHVYERLGFRRSITSDYRLYGRVLRLPSGVKDMFAIGR